MAVDPSLPKDVKKALATGDGFSQLDFGNADPGAGLRQAAAITNATPQQPGQTPDTPPPPLDNISAQNLATASRFLPGGVTRYVMDKGNEAPVYATKGKDGSIVFTDNPAYAAQVGTGQGLRRSDFNTPAYSNAPAGGRPGVEDRGFPAALPGSNNIAAGDAAFARTQGPNANLEYAPSALGGLRRNVQTYNDDQTSRALAAVQADSARNAGDPERVLSNAQDENLLQARLTGLRRQGLSTSGVPGYGAAGAFGAGGISGPLKPSDIIAAQRNAATTNYRNNQTAIAQQRLKIDQENSDRADRAQERADSQAFLGDYYKTLAQDPRAANQSLVSRLNRPDIATFLGTDAGRQIADTYFQNAIQPGLQKSTYPLLDFSSRRAAEQGKIGFQNLATDANGRFAGLGNGSEAPGDSPEFPSTGFFGGANFDPSVNNLTPATLKALRDYYRNTNAPLGDQ